jgi:uncharacterized membrane protein YcaP (DUF421 family)
MVGPDTSLTGGLLAATALFLANFILKAFIFRSKNSVQLLQGEPVMLIYKGHIKERKPAQNQITREELEAAIREHGAQGFSEVDLATLEVTATSVF